MNKKKMLVEAICDGTVLDHIPSDKLFKIVSLLQLEQIQSPITIANNLESGRCKQKGIIKINDRFFSENELNRIAILAPNVRHNVIRGYKVVEKRNLSLPDEVVGLVRCPNAKCITNAEPMGTRFTVEAHTEGGAPILECRYCSRKVLGEQVELL